MRILSTLSRIVSTPRAAFGQVLRRGGPAALCAAVLLIPAASDVRAQRDAAPETPVVVQPGAPGQATRVLPAETTAKLPPVSPKDVEFMRGMIHHHAQAVEMVALMSTRTENPALRLFGARIAQTQAEEIKFMKRWLQVRGHEPDMPMAAGMKDMKDTKMSDHKHHHRTLMPGMLTPAQMKALANAKAEEFDRLFLTGMIQHHEGALVMVEDLFNTAGAGQDAEMFTFATDVDSTQRAEIRLMREMLEKVNGEQ